MTASAATPWLASRLSGGLRTAAVLARSPQAVYVDDGGVALGVLARSAVAVPVGLRTRLDRLPRPRTGGDDTAVVGAGGIRLHGQTFEVARVATAEVPRLSGLTDAAGTLRDWVLPGADRRLDAVRAQLPTAALLLLAAADPAAVPDLLGRGDGVTPVGDDVLAGWLVTRHAAGVTGGPMTVAIARSRDRTTTLSATLLDRAAAGEAVPPLRRLLVGLAASEPPDRVRARLDELLAVGHSSGAGLALGVTLALDPELLVWPAVTSHVQLRPGAYADSVTLLAVSRQVAAEPGVAAAQVAMATPLNLDVLVSMGFDVPASTPNDMVVAVRLDHEPADDAALETAVGNALAAVDAALAAAGSQRDAGPEQQAPPRTTGSALARSGAGMALVSVPGASAFVEAMDAVDAGRDVMVFSDNVPLHQEVALKQAAERTGALVMGPDCGTAVVGGLGLGFANVVQPGPVGIVAASGTGCQQVLTLLDAAGVGVSAALGVGGRDLSAEVGGISTRQALRMLDADAATELVLVVSKPPAPEVAAGLEEFVGELSTPVRLALLAADRPDLTAAVEQLLEATGRPVPEWQTWGSPDTVARTGRLVGLFVGGTLCGEAEIIAAGSLAPDAYEMVDFGDDALTVGRAHPMIDPTLRLERFVEAAADPATGALLLDVVLGHGVQDDPAADLAPAIRSARAARPDLPVVVACVGTEGDPQGLSRQAEALADAGAQVFASNAAAARHAVSLLAPGGSR